MSGTENPNPYGRPAGQSGPQWPDAAAQAPYGQAPDASAQAPYGAPPQGWGAPQQWGGQPGWPAAAPVPARRPGPINAAFWLIVSAGVVFLASTVLSALVATSEAGRRELEAAMTKVWGDYGMTPEQIREYQDMLPQMMPVMAGVMVAVGVLALLVYLLIASKIRGGSRAARTVGTVLAVLSVLMVLAPLASGQFSPLDLLWCLLGVAGIATAYRKEATEFMRLRAWERAARR